MTPEERQLLAGLFNRTLTASTNPRDPEAEALIDAAVRQQPYAPYLLAQAVIVQEQALGAANERLQQLEARVQELEQAASSGAGSFLGGLGKSIFGSSEPQRPPSSVPSAGGSPWGRTTAPVQQGGWGQQPPPQPNQQPEQGGGGSFLKGALGAAAGVAGGMLLANSISSLFGQHHNSLGIGSGFGGLGSGGETITNNYFGGSPGAAGSGSGVDTSGIFPASSSTDADDDDDADSDDYDDSSYDGDDTTDV